MPKAGEVHLAITRRMAAAAGQWLTETYRPPPPSIMGGTTPASCSAVLSNARRIGAILLKAARRRRSGEAFTCLMQRADADWLGSHLSAIAVTRGYLVADNDRGIIVPPSNVLALMTVCHSAARSSRGRKRLELAQMERRANREVEHLDERHRKRLARRARYERKVREWLARGNTILGSIGGDDPYPKM